MDGVIAPLLHNKVPVAVVDSADVPQLFATVTIGAAGIALGADAPLPAALTHPFTVVVTV